MKVVPLAAIPSQALNVTLGNQNCQLVVYQKTTGLYLDLSVSSVPVSTTVRCVVSTRLLLDRQYSGFIGDFGFIDTQPPNGDVGQAEDPVYTGLGGRWVLIYLEAADLATS
jgi:hypothetical protein